MHYTKNAPQTPDSILESLSIIHIALLAGQVLFALVAFARSSNIYFGVMNMNDQFAFIIPVLTIGGFASGYLIFNKSIEQLIKKEDFYEKLLGYQSALISRFALIEAPSLLSVAAYMVSGNIFFIFISAGLMIYFVFLRPTRDKIQSDLLFDFRDAPAYTGQDSPINNHF